MEVTKSDEDIDFHQHPGFTDSEMMQFIDIMIAPGAESSAPLIRVILDIPIFEGRLHIEDYLDCKKSVEAFFDYLEISPNKQVKYVAYRLKGGASAWWLQLLQSRRREGRGSIRSWQRMMQLLRGHFLPTDYEQLLYLQYQHCSQGQRTVNEYIEEFYRLSACNNLQESEN